MKLFVALVQVLSMVGIPVVAGIVAHRRTRVPWRFFGLGALAFVLSQAAHVPMLAIVRVGRFQNVWVIALLLGLMAGICEEPARYAMYRFWLKRDRRARDGLMAGLGHGGIESMLLGLAVGASIIGALLLPADAPPDRRAAAELILNAPAHLRLLAVFERIAAMSFHVSASMLVLRAIRSERVWYLLLSIGWHTMLNAGVLISLRFGGILASTVFLAVAGVASLGIAATMVRTLIAGDPDEAIEPTAEHRDTLAENDPSLLSCERLEKTFGTVIAVRDLDLTLRRGEIYALLGPNGAGKTTTIRMLCGLIAPSAGSVRFRGRIVTADDSEFRSRVGILTETPGLYDRLTAWQNLEFHARLHELSASLRAARIEELLRQFGLHDRRNDAVVTFSKGMRQKLAIARAILHRPDVIFLDEPTSGLDPEASREVREMIVGLRASGCAVLLTTHRLEEAEELADRVGIFKARLLIEDTLQNLERRLFAPKLAIRVGGDSARAAGAVGELNCVRVLKASGVNLEIEVDDLDRAAPIIVRELVQRGVDVRSVGDVRYSLEDVYLDMIRKAEA